MTVGSTLSLMELRTKRMSVNPFVRTSFRKEWVHTFPSHVPFSAFLLEGINWNLQTGWLNCKSDHRTITQYSILDLSLSYHIKLGLFMNKTNLYTLYTERISITLKLDSPWKMCDGQRWSYAERRYRAWYNSPVKCTLFYNISNQIITCFIYRNFALNDSCQTVV